MKFYMVMKYHVSEITHGNLKESIVQSKKYSIIIM